MLIKIGYEFIFQVQMPSLMLLMVALHPDRENSVRRHKGMIVEPYLPVQEFRDVYGNRCRRIFPPAGPLRLWDEIVVEDSGLPDPVMPWARQHLAQELPAETLLYLLSSRYCEVDRLMEIAWSLFGGAPQGWGRVQAVCNWVHANVRFDYQAARPTKTAYEVFVERVGVCRDFAHLALTFCRCLCIPAVCHGLPWGHRRADRAMPYGFQRLVRSLPRRSVAHLRCPAQHPPDRPCPDGAGTRCSRRGHDDLVRKQHPAAFHGLDGRGS